MLHGIWSPLDAQGATSWRNTKPHSMCVRRDCIGCTHCRGRLEETELGPSQVFLGRKEEEIGGKPTFSLKWMCTPLRLALLQGRLSQVFASKVHQSKTQQWLKIRNGGERRSGALKPGLEQMLFSAGVQHPSKSHVGADNYSLQHCAGPIVLRAFTPSLPLLLVPKQRHLAPQWHISSFPEGINLKLCIWKKIQVLCRGKQPAPKLQNQGSKRTRLD